MQKNKTINVLFTIFTIVGILLMVVGIVILVKFQLFAKTADEVTATITDIKEYRTENSDGETEYDHDVFVRYEYEGYTHDVKLSIYSSSMRVGKNITLLVDPDNPRKVKVKGLESWPALIPIGIGLVFALIGIIPLIVIRKNERKARLLMQNGRRLQAVIDEIKENTTISVNDSHPFVIYCSYDDGLGGNVYHFKSGNIWSDPYEVCDVGSVIDVWVKQDDYSQYYVDVDALVERRIMEYT